MDRWHPLKQFARARQVGFSIVELMVAILIGLIILAGVLQVVMSSRATYLGQEDMSFIQENARYAMDVIGKDIQGAGYLGCAGATASSAMVATTGGAFNDFLGSEPLVGFAGNSVDDFPDPYGDNILQNGTAPWPDSLIVRRAVGQPASITDHVGTQFTMQANHGFAADQFLALVAEDCRRVGVIRTSEVTGATVRYSEDTVCSNVIKPPRGENITCDSVGATQQLYLPGSTAHRYQARAYYIAESGLHNGLPALMRMTLHGNGGLPEELALGVENMQLRYGVETAAGLQYLSADAVDTNNNWRNVVSVEVTLLLRAQTPSLPNADEREFLGQSYTDRFVRQVVTSTFRLRNRI